MRFVGLLLLCSAALGEEVRVLNHNELKNQAQIPNHQFRLTVEPNPLKGYDPFQQKGKLNQYQNPFIQLNQQYKLNHQNLDITCQQTPQSEVTAALKFAQELAATNPEKATYLKFFSTYNIPDEFQEEIFYALSFWVHSLAAPGFNIVGVPQRVPYSPTLYYVCFNNYGWLRESFEFVAKVEPYFREHSVNFQDLNNLRLVTGGNSIVRADWFVTYTSDTCHQFDRDDPNILYYILIYGKGKEPKNLLEFQNAWGVDLAEAAKRKLDLASIVKSKTVSRHNRQLKRVRTLTGYYWETFDVRNELAQRDYVENLFPNDNARDAAEAIVSNNLGLQVYHLAAFEKGVDKRVEFGDPTVVRSIRDPHGDVRVRTARSCVMCHSEGIIPFNPELTTLLKQGKFNIELAARNKDVQLEIQRFYFGPIDELVEDDRLVFKRAVRIVNGQNPLDNAVMFNNVLLRYDRPVDLATAAKECGVTEEVFKEKIKLSVSGRLLDLLNGRTIPRNIWDNPVVNAGTFGHAMLFVNGTNINIQSGSYGGRTFGGQPIVDEITHLGAPTVIKQTNVDKLVTHTIKDTNKVHPVFEGYSFTTDNSTRRKARLKPGSVMFGINLEKSLKSVLDLRNPEKWHDGYIIAGDRYIGYINKNYREPYTNAFNPSQSGHWRKLTLHYANPKAKDELVLTEWYVLEQDLIFD